MALKFCKVFSAVHAIIIILLLASSSFAQPTRETLEILQTAQGPQKTEEEDKAAKEFEKKALALINELVAEGRSLSLARNRIHILITASDFLGTRDGGRALIREAMDQSVASFREAEEKPAQDGAQYFDFRNSPREVLDKVIKMDAKLALEFLPLMRSLQPLEYEEKRQELELATELARSDPQTALQVAERHLDGKLDYQVIDFWMALLRKDAKAASNLTGKVIGELKSQEILDDGDRVIYTVLERFRSRAMSIADDRDSPIAADDVQPDSAEVQQVYRDVLEIFAASALNVMNSQVKDWEKRSRAATLIPPLHRFLPEIEKNLPSRSPAVHAKLAEFEKALNLQPANRESAREKFETMVENKSPDELIAMAGAQQPAESRYWLYATAVLKLTEQGDKTRASQIAKEFLPGFERWNPVIAEIRLEERVQALKEGRPEETRKSIMQLGSSEEQSLAWIKVATKAEAGKDQKSQQESLKEASELLGDQIETSSEVNAQLALAAASLNFDPDRAFEILGSVIDRLNAVVSAMGTITKFNQRKLSPTGINIKGEGDELDMTIFLDEFADSLARSLPAFAGKDFDRTVAALKRAQPEEFRLATYLMLLNGIYGGANDSKVTGDG
jgi:hypothetical protein